MDSLNPLHLHVSEDWRDHEENQKRGPKWPEGESHLYPCFLHWPWTEYSWIATVEMCGNSSVTECHPKDDLVSCRERQGMMTNSHMRVKRREGAKPALKPVSLLLPIFPTCARFLRNVMSYGPYHFVGFICGFFFKNSSHLGKRTQQKHCTFVCSDLM